MYKTGWRAPRVSLLWGRPFRIFNVSLASRSPQEFLLISLPYRRARLGIVAGTAFLAACGGGGGETTTEPSTPAALSAVSSVPTSLPVGSAVSTPLTVIVNDSKGRAVPSVVVTFRVSAGNGTLSTGAATTDATGKASTTFTLGSAAGTNEVTASVTGVATTVKFSVTGIPASACTTPLTIGTGQVVTDLTTACLGGATGQDYTAVVIGMSPTAAAKSTVEIVGTSLGTAPVALSVSTLPTTSFGLLERRPVLRATMRRKRR